MSLLCWKNTDAFLEYDSALASVSCCNISVTGRLCIQQTLSQPRIFLQARLQALADNAVRHAVSRPKVLSKLLSHQTPDTTPESKGDLLQTILLKSSLHSQGDVWPPASEYWMHVCIIDMVGWQLVAVRDSCQLSTQLFSSVRPILCTPTSCARTAEPGGHTHRHYPAHCRQLDPVYHMLWSQPPWSNLWTPASHHHHVHALRHLDGWFLQGKKVTTF